VRRRRGLRQRGGGLVVAHECATLKAEKQNDKKIDIFREGFQPSSDLALSLLYRVVVDLFLWLTRYGL